MLRVVLVLALAAPVSAESLVATRTIRARTLVLPEDVTLVSAEVPGALDDPAAAQMGQALRQRAIQQYDWRRAGQMIVALGGTTVDG